MGWLHLNRWSGEVVQLSWVSCTMPLDGVFCCSLEERGAASQGPFKNYFFFYWETRLLMLGEDALL